MIVPIGIVFALVVLAIIVSLLLRRKLREKYATLWLVIGIVVLILAFAPALLGALAHALGVALPSNLLFALAIVLLVGVALHLSWELSAAEDEIRRLAEEAAIIRAEHDRLSGRVEALERALGHDEPDSDQRREPADG